MGFIGKYETFEQIGSGAMGSVYRARDIVLDRDVALKLLHTGQDIDFELKERFYREARAGAKLRHPNIVFVYDLGEADGSPYIAMELLTGIDLRRHVIEASPLSLAQKVEFAAQICDGLAHAHRAGIVHRDIKPSNVFLHEDRQIKILDFGIARLPSSKLTVVGRVLGTPNYMAPEQIQSQPCDTRSDIFSTAIVIYEFLVNAHPFQGTFIPRRIAEDEPDSLLALDPLIPKSLETLLHGALAKNPNDRPHSADEFAMALRAVGQELRTAMAIPGVSLDRDSTPLPNTAEQNDAPEVSGEWRVSEFIRLLGDFDQAAAARQPSAMKRVLEQMHQLHAIDRRFADAMTKCEEQYAEISAQESPAVAAASATSIGVPEAPKKSPADTAPSASDITRVAPVRPAGPRVDYRAKADRWKRRVAERGQTESERLRHGLQSVRTRWTSASKKQQQVLLASLGFLAVVAVAVGLTLSANRPDLLQPFVAEATVRAPRAEVQSPDRKAVMMTLGQGARVHILRYPDAASAELLLIQAMSKNQGSRPGLIRRADLGGWTGPSAASVWPLLRMYAPAQDAPEIQVNRFVVDLHEFAASFPGSAEATEARSLAGSLQIAAASRLPCGDVRRVDLLRLLKDVPDEGISTKARAMESDCATAAAAFPASAIRGEAQPQPQNDETACLAAMRSLWSSANYGAMMKLAEARRAVDPASGCAQRYDRRAKDALRVLEELRD